MKLLFQNRLLPELKGDIGLGKGLHGGRLTKHIPCAVFADSWTGRRRKVFLLNGRVPSELTALELAYVHFSPVTNIHKQVL
mgnify:CR=1|jgi:hypothetical protein